MEENGNCWTDENIQSEIKELYYAIEIQLLRIQFFENAILEELSKIGVVND